jgi:alpha-L-rhamnosidase
VSSVSAPASLRFEHRTDDGTVLGIGTGSPRLSWIIPTADAAFAQVAYEIESTTARTTDVHRVESQEQVLVPWPGRPFSSRESATLRVRVAGKGGEVSDWSAPATVEAGLLESADWTARFVSPAQLGEIGAPAPILAHRHDRNRRLGPRARPWPPGAYPRARRPRLRHPC